MKVLVPLLLWWVVHSDYDEDDCVLQAAHTNAILPEVPSEADNDEASEVEALQDELAEQFGEEDLVTTEAAIWSQVEGIAEMSCSDVDKDGDGKVSQEEAGAKAASEESLHDWDRVVNDWGEAGALPCSRWLEFQSAVKSGLVTELLNITSEIQGRCESGLDPGLCDEDLWLHARLRQLYEQHSPNSDAIPELLQIILPAFSSQDENSDGLISALESNAADDVWANTLGEADQDEDNHLNLTEMANLLAKRHQSSMSRINTPETADHNHFFESKPVDFPPEEQDTMPPPEEIHEMQDWPDGVEHVEVMPPDELPEESDEAEDDVLSEEEEEEEEASWEPGQLRPMHPSTPEYVANITMSDSHVSDDQVVAVTQALFQVSDLNKDGFISLAEYTTLGPATVHTSVPWSAIHGMEVHDKGFPEAARAWEFQQLDMNNDGLLSPSELVGEIQGRGWMHGRHFHSALRHAAAGPLNLPSLVVALMEVTYTRNQLWQAKPGEEKWTSLSQSSSSGVLSGRSRRRRGSEEGNPCCPEADCKPACESFNKEVAKVALKVMTNVVATDFCVRQHYDRGWGEAKPCASGWNKKGALCYPNCNPGWSRNWEAMEQCEKNCPSGTTDIGTYCRTNGRTKAKFCGGTCWPNDWCCRGWCSAKEHYRRRRDGARRRGCDTSKYADTGCFCEPAWNYQSRYWSGSCAMTETRCTTCQGRRRAFQETSAGNMNCLELRRSGYECDITTCRQKCILDEHKHVCGLGYCAADSATCGFKVSTMISTVTEATFNTIQLMLTFGASSASTVSKTAATSISKKVSSKVISKTMKRVASMRQQIQARTRDEIKGKLADEFFDGVKDNILSAAVAAFLTAVEKKGESGSGFDPSMDPTGVVSAVASVGGSPADQVTAWLNVFSIVDPTGWVSAAGAFVANPCSPGQPLEWRRSNHGNYCMHNRGTNMIIGKEKCVFDSEKQKFLVPEHENGMGTIRLASDTTKCLRADSSGWFKYVRLKSCDENDQHQLFNVRGSTGRRRAAVQLQPDAQEVKIWSQYNPGYCLQFSDSWVYLALTPCAGANKFFVPERQFR